MRITAAALITPMLLGGCSAYDSSGPDLPPAPTSQCVAEPAMSFVGQKATSDAGAEIKRLTGSSVFQWVPEGSPVTMDYRVERVRVTYDANMIILRIRCG